MDLHTRQLLDEAIALDDKARADYARWEAEQAEREWAQARTQLVYKVHEPKVAAQQQRTAPMVDAVDKAWVLAQLDLLAAVVGEETFKEINALKAEIAEMKQKNVTPMRKQSAA